MRTLVIVTLLAVAVDVGHASDGCKAKCDDSRASCTKACADAPVVQECKASCGEAYDKCMSDCGSSPGAGKQPGAVGAGGGW
jgi:hypothetical protein